MPWFKPTDSLIQDPAAYWKFDDDSNTSTAVDSEGSNDGSISGATYTTTAKEGKALDFDGTDDYVAVPMASEINIGNTFSICMWVKKRTSGDFDYILRTTDTSNSYITAFVRIEDTGEARAHYSDGDGDNASAIGSTQIDDGNFYHVAGTFDPRNGNVEIYVDGSEEAVDSNTSVNTETSDGDWNIGRVDDGFYLDGIIDDVRFYDKELSSSEISTIYNNTK